MLLDTNSRLPATCNQDKNKQKNLKAHSFLDLELEVRRISVLVSLHMHIVYLSRVKAHVICKNSHF